MATAVSKAEYLKRYLVDDKKTKRKKKVKTSSHLVPRMKIIDETIDLRAIKFGEEEIIDKEDAPVVAEIIDERPEEVKTKEMYQESKWKRLDATLDEDQESSAVRSENLMQTKNRSRHDSDSDCSPPRKNQNSQKRHDSGSDCSPPRKQSSSIGKRRHDSDSDISPPRINSHNKNQKRNSHSQSKKHDSDSDLSPERVRSKLKNHSDSDISPPREKDASKYENSSRKDRKRKKGECIARKRVKNRERSLGYSGFVKPVFTKDSKPPLGKGKDH
ncbi:hypothetical protein TNCV_2195051 [Trichonephila clavipes]|uniref:BUD13 homolog n=1 Tax=Trichonephila clavipes TaxID=2585209 RepID=A0A8X6VFG5_TRICX|nr:hypothetical protein TNCV_2195051 [Trichonephila clavipes]